MALFVLFYIDYIDSGLKLIEKIFLAQDVHLRSFWNKNFDLILLFLLDAPLCFYQNINDYLQLFQNRESVDWRWIFIDLAYRNLKAVLLHNKITMLIFIVAANIYCWFGLFERNLHLHLHGFNQIYVAHGNVKLPWKE